MNKAGTPEYIGHISDYLIATGACGLILHTSDEQSPYSDFDFFVVYNGLRGRNRFVRDGKKHVERLGEVMPARLILNWVNPYGGVNSLFDVEGEVVKVDISAETLQSIQGSNGILKSTLVYDATGKLDSVLGARKEDCLKRNFYTPPKKLQSLLEEYYGYNWNALSKLWRGDYRLVAFELVPVYLSIIARLEHASNGRINTNFYNSDRNMRSETTRRLDEIDIRPQLGALVSTHEKLQLLFHDLGTQVAAKHHLVFPDEAEKLFLAELDKLKLQKG